MKIGHAVAVLASLWLALQPAFGQEIGTPGNAPLVPGGPRQGIGPPSITDSVPDLRLRAPGGGIPGAGPPVGGGGVYQPSRPPPSFSRPVGGRVDRDGCRPAAGYRWCARTARCERPWELAKAKRFPNSQRAFARYCGARR